MVVFMIIAPSSRVFDHKFAQGRIMLSSNAICPGIYDKPGLESELGLIYGLITVNGFVFLMDMRFKIKYETG